MERRDFLKGMGLVAGAIFFDPMKTVAGNNNDSQKKKLIHRNTASLARVLAEVLEYQATLLKETHHIQNDLVDAQFGTLIQKAEGAKKYFAQLLNVDTNELAFTANTTTSLNMVAEGLKGYLFKLSENQRKKFTVITTNLEHPGGVKGWQDLQKSAGIQINTLQRSPAPTPEQVLSSIKQQLETNPDIKVISISHTTYQTGTVLPIKQIKQLCKDLGRGDILLVVDGAQAGLDVNATDLGCDAYLTSGHKWLGGPASSGLLYIKKSAQELIKPSNLQDGYGVYTGATGTQNLIGMSVLQKSVQTMLGNHEQKIVWDNIVKTRGELYDALSDLGMTMLSPESSELQKSGIVSFSVDIDYKHADLVLKLKEKGHIVKIIPGGIRLSINPNTSNSMISKHIQKFVEDLKEILGR